MCQNITGFCSVAHQCGRDYEADSKHFNVYYSPMSSKGKHSEFPGVDIPVNLSKAQTAMIRETAKSQEVSDSTDFS